MKYIRGTYGSMKTEANIICVEEMTSLGEAYWYVVEGSHNINLTFDNIENGVDVEILRDEDTITSSTPIESLSDLMEAIDI